MTLARAQKSPRRDLSSTKLPGSQTRCVVTRAPWELMLCVEVVSALQLRLRLASSTGSAKIARACLRMPPLVPAVTSSGWDTCYLSHPHYRSASYSVNPVFTLKEGKSAKVEAWKSERVALSTKKAARGASVQY